MAGLKSAGVDVQECAIAGGGIRQWLKLIKKYIKADKDYDIMFLAHGGVQLAAPLAKILSRKKVIADPIISLYDTMVYDRKKCHRLSFRGFYYYFLDWLMVKLADIIILDTNENINYFSKNFYADKTKFRRLFIGSENLLCPKIIDNSIGREFIVHFHGYFIPLHGIEHIIKAAKILENESIVFRIIGRGQTYGELKKLADELKISNIFFVNPIPRDKIQEYVCNSDVVLGIFGNTGKTARVIPNKVYDALATGRAIITADTPAARELLEDGNNCLFCRAADPKDIADKIMILKNNPNLLEKIADGGYKLFKEKLKPKIITAEFKKILQEACMHYD